MFKTMKLFCVLVIACLPILLFSSTAKGGDNILNGVLGTFSVDNNSQPFQVVGFEPIVNLTCSGTASKATITLNLSNPGSSADSVEIKLWADNAGNLISIVNAASVSLDAKLNKDITLATNASLPAGIDFAVRLLDPTTGDEISSDTCGY